MQTFTCDGCARRIVEPVYLLQTIYHIKTGEHRDEHFHWECLRRYMTAN